MKPWFALMGALVLGGCASWGGNVSGDFACKAPQGTCAPTAEIDARAVERAASSRRQAGSAPSPAGAWASRTALGAGLVRTGERVLRIAFYPRIDEAGVFHEPAVVHAVVEGSGWQALPSSPPSVPVAVGGVKEARPTDEQAAVTGGYSPTAEPQHSAGPGGAAVTVADEGDKQ